nr:immunoglobulin heavy chain junction region [Mus musculus]
CARSPLLYFDYW